MDILVSRYRITYIPDGGEPLVLLSPLDLCDGEPRFDGSPETQVEPSLLAAWVNHHSRGNANISLAWDCYTESPCLEQSQARGLELWRYLTTHPEGTLIMETAFMGTVSWPLVRWSMHATLNHASYRDLDVDSAPFAGPGYHMDYDFLISNPTNA